MEADDGRDQKEEEQKDQEEEEEDQEDQEDQEDLEDDSLLHATYRSTEDRNSSKAMHEGDDRDVGRAAMKKVSRRVLPGKLSSAASAAIDYARYSHE